MNPLPVTPLSRRAKWAVALLVATIVVDVITIADDVYRVSVINAFMDGNADFDALESSDNRQAIIGFVTLAVAVATAVTFIRWFHAAYRNITALGAGSLRFGTGWAIGAWFVPFLNLVRPKQIANDIWRASDPDAPEEQGISFRQGATAHLLTVWWVVWLVSSFALNIVALTFGGDTPSSLVSSAKLDVAALLLEIASAVIAIYLVRDLTDRQHRRVARLDRRLTLFEQPA